jgi:hypothetical protein
MLEKHSRILTRAVCRLRKPVSIPLTLSNSRSLVVVELETETTTDVHVRLERNVGSTQVGISNNQRRTIYT